MSTRAAGGFRTGSTFVRTSQTEGKIELGCGIRQILPKKGSYEICTKNGNFHAKTCILATGGKSAKYTGSDGSGFLYLGPLSHHVIDLVPALTRLQANHHFLRTLQESVQKPE